MILTGDLHANCVGELEFLKPEYLISKFNDACKNTIIIILGDGGFLWANDRYSDFNGELIKTLESYLEQLNSKIVVVPGNHENYPRIYGLPKTSVQTELVQGDFRKISKNILYTERFGEYTIEGKSVLVLGGAVSLDRYLRKENEWFQDEIFSLEEKETIISLIKDSEYDYVLSHTCPHAVLRQIFVDVWFRDNNSEFFDRVLNYIEPKAWFFGHLHPEKTELGYNFGNFDDLKINNTIFKCFYKDMQGCV